MEYDSRTRTGSQYESNIPSYSRPPSAATSSSAVHPMYGQSSLYPKIGGGVAAHGRNPPFHPAPTLPPSSGIGIRVSIKPEYRISPPPQLLPQLGDVPRSNFHFHFEFERNVLTEALKEKQNWNRLGIENLPAKATESNYSYGANTDPRVNQYVAGGPSREAVRLAIEHFGDNPTKVKEFANGFTALRDMGFPPNQVVEALLMYDNDTDKALAHCLSNSS